MVERESPTRRVTSRSLSRRSSIAALFVWLVDFIFGTHIVEHEWIVSYEVRGREPRRGSRTKILVYFFLSLVCAATFFCYKGYQVSQRTLCQYVKTKILVFWKLIL